MIISFGDKDFYKFLGELSDCRYMPPFYQESRLEYTTQVVTDEGMKLDNISFIMLLNNKPVAGFVGATVEKNSKVNILAYEMPALFVERKALTKKAKKQFLQEFDHRTRNCNHFYLTDHLYQGAISTLSLHLLNAGAKAIPRFSQVLDLKEDKALLWRKIRKRYTSLINNGLRDLQPKIVDSRSITWEMMKEFQDLHIREAGRRTRSEQSWKRQYEMVKAGGAFAIFGTFEDKLVTAGLFSFNSTNCYYWVSASRRDLFDKPMFHAVMWTAILYAKKLGCRWFEVGEQLYINYPADKLPTKKELGISDFKAGFGGETRVFMDFKLDRIA